MQDSDLEAQQLLKTFLQKAVPLFQGAKEAQSRQDWPTLGRISSELQKVSTESSQVMIEVQAQLLEQSAEQAQLQRSGYLLQRIQNSLAQVLTEVKSGGGFVTAIAEKPSPVSAVETAQPTPVLDQGKRLGNYLVEAELLTPEQIEIALADQKTTGARLGEILSLRGWIKQGTIEFLMQKVILPDRRKSSIPEPASVESSPPADLPAPDPSPNALPAVDKADDFDSRATFVDANSSTYIY
jgi:hypothetical protein